MCWERLLLTIQRHGHIIIFRQLSFSLMKVGRDTGRNRNYVQMIGVLLWGTPHDPLRWCVVALPLGKLFLIGRLPTGTTGTFICEALRVLLPPPATRARPLSAESFLARWRPPPRLQRRGDRLRRCRHSKARLLMCGASRRARPCARTLILAGSDKRQPSLLCERNQVRRCT